MNRKPRLVERWQKFLSGVGEKEYFVQVPLDSPDLPYPGDGREWEVVNGNAVEILTPPFDKDWNRLVAVRYPGRNPFFLRISDLRLRTPEHKPWCESLECPDLTAPGATCTFHPCTCERRVFQRREGERRKLKGGTALNRTNRPLFTESRKGGEPRLGTDRRKG